MLNGVGRHVDRADVVTIDQHGTAKRGMELLEKLSQPGRLSNGVGDSTILSFSTGSGDSVLALAGPGDEIVPKKHDIARGGLACVWTTGPISIRIGHHIHGRRTQ